MTARLIVVGMAVEALAELLETTLGIDAFAGTGVATLGELELEEICGMVVLAGAVARAEELEDGVVEGIMIIEVERVVRIEEDVTLGKYGRTAELLLTVPPQFES